MGKTGPGKGSPGCCSAPCSSTSSSGAGSQPASAAAAAAAAAAVMSAIGPGSAASSTSRRELQDLAALIAAVQAKQSLPAVRWELVAEQPLSDSELSRGGGGDARSAGLGPAREVEHEAEAGPAAPARAWRVEIALGVAGGAEHTTLTISRRVCMAIAPEAALAATAHLPVPGGEHAARGDAGLRSGAGAAAAVGGHDAAAAALSPELQRVFEEQCDALEQRLVVLEGRKRPAPPSDAAGAGGAGVAPAARHAPHEAAAAAAAAAAVGTPAGQQQEASRPPAASGAATVGEEAAAATTDEPPLDIGEYLVHTETVLGVGAYGVVMLGVEKSTGAQVGAVAVPWPFMAFP